MPAEGACLELRTFCARMRHPATMVQRWRMSRRVSSAKLRLAACSVRRATVSQDDASTLHDSVVSARRSTSCLHAVIRLLVPRLFGGDTRCVLPHSRSRAAACSLCPQCLATTCLICTRRCLIPSRMRRHCRSRCNLLSQFVTTIHMFFLLNERWLVTKKTVHCAKHHKMCNMLVCSRRQQSRSHSFRSAVKKRGLRRCRVTLPLPLECTFESRREVSDRSVHLSTERASAAFDVYLATCDASWAECKRTPVQARCGQDCFWYRS